MSDEGLDLREEEGKGHILAKDLHEVTVNLIPGVELHRNLRCLEELDNGGVYVPDGRFLAKQPQVARSHVIKAMKHCLEVTIPQSWPEYVGVQRLDFHAKANPAKLFLHIDSRFLHPNYI